MFALTTVQLLSKQKKKSTKLFSLVVLTQFDFVADERDVKPLINHPEYGENESSLCITEVTTCNGQPSSSSEDEDNKNDVKIAMHQLAQLDQNPFAAPKAVGKATTRKRRRKKSRLTKKKKTRVYKFAPEPSIEHFPPLPDELLEDLGPEFKCNMFSCIFCSYQTLRSASLKQHIMDNHV